jgi:hypothetical protein
MQVSSLGFPSRRFILTSFRIRRVKCDEEKPSCRKCLTTGRKCDGYAMPKSRKGNNKSNGTVEDLHPPANSLTKINVPWNPSMSIDGSENQRRGFRYFQTRRFSQMAGNFEFYFWDTAILQYSHSFPVVQHSLLALSAIYEERTLESLTLTGHTSDNKYVLEQYTKAVAGLVEYISTDNQDPRATLISCLLLVWVELLQRNIDEGFQHLFSGFKILTHLRDSGKVTDSNEGIEDVYAALDRSFTRLRIQLSIHGSTTDEIAKTRPLTLDNAKAIPLTFSSIDQSRVCLDNEFKAIFEYFRMVRNRIDDCGNLDVIDRKSDAFIRQAHILRLEQWGRATMEMVENNLCKAESAEFIYLQLYHLLAMLLLKVPGAENEMDFDKYTAEFEQIVMLTERLAGYQENIYPLSFEMGVIPPLFFVGLKCRILRIRRKAMDLMRQAPEQEGLWMRNDCLSFLEWKINTEETDRGDVPETEPLPLGARISQEHLANDEVDLDNFKLFERGRSLKIYVRYRKADLLTGFRSMELVSEMKYMEWMGNMI